MRAVFGASSPPNWLPASMKVCGSANSRTAHDFCTLTELSRPQIFQHVETPGLIVGTRYTGGKLRRGNPLSRQAHH